MFTKTDTERFAKHAIILGVIAKCFPAFYQNKILSLDDLYKIKIAKFCINTEGMLHPSILLHFNFLTLNF